MRIFIADTSMWFLSQLQQLFRHTRVDHTCYAATFPLEASKLFRASPVLHTTCLVQPCEKANKLSLQPFSTAKYMLTCPAPAFNNTRVLMKTILRFLLQQDVRVDVIVVPALGEQNAQTAYAMHGAIVDVMIKAS